MNDILERIDVLDNSHMISNPFKIWGKTITYFFPKLQL